MEVCYNRDPVELPRLWQRDHAPRRALRRPKSNVTYVSAEDTVMDHHQLQRRGVCVVFWSFRIGSWSC